MKPENPSVLGVAGHEFASSIRRKVEDDAGAGDADGRDASTSGSGEARRRRRRFPEIGRRFLPYATIEAEKVRRR